jgi:SAM-dependent methyltransferase
MFAALRQTLLDYHHRTVRVPRGDRIVASLAGHLGRVDSLLDVGCGDGVYTLALARAVGATTVAGVDVHIRPTAQIDVKEYDGVHLPHPDQSFDGVCLIDVLHHCAQPLVVLTEALRVARRVVAIKDHFAFGPVSEKILYLLDMAGNARDQIPSPGTYFRPAQWVAMVSDAGGRVAALDWPLAIHTLPWSLVARPSLQFTAKVVPVRG